MDRTRIYLVVVTVVVVLAVFVTGAFFAWRMILTGPEAAPVSAASETTAAISAAADSLDGSAPISAAVTISSGAVAATTIAVGSAIGSGDTFVEAVGMSPGTFNPLFATDPAAESIIDKIYPRLVGQDPNGGFVVPAALAEHWQISPDGRTYTFTLRSGVQWSDGVPVTANDFKFTYDALASPQVQSPYRDRTVGIAKIDAPDASTVVVSLMGPNCAILHSLGQPLLPSHKFAADFSDLSNNLLNQKPVVGAGPFLFADHLPADQISVERVELTRNPNYWQGAPAIGNWEVRVIADPNARSQALNAGIVDLAYFTADETADETTTTTSGVSSTVTMKYIPTDGYSFLALNLADPMNPQPGRASDGTSVAQTPHPILGDLAVRQAIAAAIDYDRIIQEVYHGRALRTASYVPTTVDWAYARDLPLPAYDPERAAQLLDGAGWVSDNGGVRTRGGQPLHLSLRTNEDNPQRVAMAHLIADELTAVGVQVDLQVVSFDELTTDLLGQRFDLVVIGWENLGADPGNAPFWHSQADIPGTGFNFSSFHDDEVDNWLASAAQLPGCDLNRRGDIYKQVQARIASQQPYIFLAVQESAWGYQNRWQGIAPGPWGIEYNVASWRLP